MKTYRQILKESKTPSKFVPFTKEEKRDLINIVKGLGLKNYKFKQYTDELPSVNGEHLLIGLDSGVELSIFKMYQDNKFMSYVFSYWDEIESSNDYMDDGWNSSDAKKWIEDKVKDYSSEPEEDYPEDYWLDDED